MVVTLCLRFWYLSQSGHDSQEGVIKKMLIKLTDEDYVDPFQVTSVSANPDENVESASEFMFRMRKEAIAAARAELGEGVDRAIYRGDVASGEGG